jgi:hypothetical protein
MCIHKRVAGGTSEGWEEPDDDEKEKSANGGWIRTESASFFRHVDPHRKINPVDCPKFADFRASNFMTIM